MRTMNAASSTLLAIDFQARLVPAIDNGAGVIANARRLIDAASLFDIPVLLTEQNPTRLGPTVEELAPRPPAVVHKMTFDCSRGAGFFEKLGGRPDVIVMGCEAHVCVLQTALGLLDAGRRVFVVADAIGSRRAESKEAAIRRMERQGAEIVTTEMVIFEWLGTAEHPHFREAAALIK
jgi:nicotinamidase-related amidase